MSPVAPPRFFVRLPTSDTPADAMDVAERVGAVDAPVLHLTASGEVVGAVEVSQEAPRAVR